MCLGVYLGVDRALTEFTTAGLGEIGLEPEARVPEALAGKRLVYHVSDRVPTGWNCSCIFLDDILPWEVAKGYDPADPDTAVRERAYAGLARIAAAAVKVDSGALIFACWAGDEAKEPKVVRELPPEELRAGRLIFDDSLDGGTGGNPPVLIRLVEGA